MPNIEWLSTFCDQATAQGARSTIVRPLTWLIGLLLSTLMIILYINVATWLLLLLAVLLCVSFVMFCSTFVYFALKNPDYLRSERYTLTKMAIEKHLYGDRETGLIEQVDVPLVKTLPEPPTELGQDAPAPERNI